MLSISTRYFAHAIYLNQIFRICYLSLSLSLSLYLSLSRSRSFAACECVDGWARTYKGPRTPRRRRHRRPRRSRRRRRRGRRGRQSSRPRPSRPRTRPPPRTPRRLLLLLRLLWTMSLPQLRLLDRSQMHHLLLHLLLLRLRQRMGLVWRRRHASWRRRPSWRERLEAWLHGERARRPARRRHRCA